MLIVDAAPPQDAFATKPVWLSGAAKAWLASLVANGIIAVVSSAPATAGGLVDCGASIVRLAGKSPPALDRPDAEPKPEVSTFAFSAGCVAVETGVLASALWSTLPSPKSILPEGDGAGLSRDRDAFAMRASISGRDLKKLCS